MDFASFERQHRGVQRRLEHLGVEPLEQRDVAPFLRRRENDNAAAFDGWKLSIVEIIAVETDQRTAKLPREAVVFVVMRAAKVIVLDDEQRVPLKDVPHRSEER